MRHVVQNYRSGELALVDAPVPACRPGGVLVRTRYSLISAGTELMKVSEAKLSLLGKARQRPDQVKKVLASVAQQGLQATYEKAMNRLDSYTPLGYSLCGEVIEVGAGIDEFAVGDLVACAGNQYALHAEVNWVPRNLVVAVPAGVDPRHAAFTTVGAIALQGLRQGEVQLGDVAVVVGLGLVGQLLVQLLVAAGVRVIGVDLSQTRCDLACRLGAIAAARPGAGDDAIEALVAEASEGHGADRVFLAAGAPTNEPLELAVRLARDRARIVDIGKCTLDLPWNDSYEKELEIRFSRSYGPGRYDPVYEEQGVDYPIGYVRWTERRNLGAFLDLVARGRLDLAPLVDHVVPFDDAVALYGQLAAGSMSGIGVLFEYPDAVVLDRRVERPADAPPAAARRRAAAIGARPVRLGFVGAGNYASSMLLPHLVGRADTVLAEVVTSSSLSSLNAQRKFGFERAGTDVEALLGDASVDAVFVVTRHASHADLVCQVLRAGKAVFVEKPLAVDEEQLAQILDTVATTGNDRLLVGFNRRFSPLLVETRRRFGTVPGPRTLRYLVNAGRLDHGSWYAAQGEGSRFVGEGCHFVDTASWWLGADPVEVMAVAAPDDPDDLAAVFRYPDGSTATIAYATNGHPRFPKETIEVLGGGRTARFDNFRRAAVWSGRRKARLRARGRVDKGQRAELDAFLDAVRSGGPMPIPLPSLVATTDATLAVARSLAARGPEPVKPR